MRDLCKTPLFSQFLCQAQILILKILNVFLWLIRLRRIAFLELEPRLNINYGFNWAGKNEYFLKVSMRE